MATWAESAGHGADRERCEGPLSQCGIAHAVGSVAPLVGGVPASEGPQSQPAHHGWAVSQPADRYGHRPLAWRAPHRSWMLCQKRSYLALYLRGISGRIRQFIVANPHSMRGSKSSRWPLIPVHEERSSQEAQMLLGFCQSFPHCYAMMSFCLRGDSKKEPECYFFAGGLCVVAVRFSGISESLAHGWMTVPRYW